MHAEKRLDMLNPNRELTEKNQKMGQSFKKQKKPELFPVKDEHKNPCSYLKKNHSALNQRNVSIQRCASSIIHFIFRSPSPKSYENSKRIQSTSRRGRWPTRPLEIQERRRAKETKH